MIKQFRCYEELSVSSASVLLYVNEKKNIATNDNEILRICHDLVYVTMLIRNYRHREERSLIHICKAVDSLQCRWSCISDPNQVFLQTRVDISRFSKSQNIAGGSNSRVHKVKSSAVITFAFRSFSYRDDFPRESEFAGLRTQL